MGRGSLIIVLGASVVLSIMNLQLNKSSEQAVENMVGYYDQSLARDLANQSVSYLLSELADSATWRVHYPATLPSSLFSDIGAHTVTYTIKDTTLKISGTDKDAIKLDVSAVYGKHAHNVVVYTEWNFGFIPTPVRGAFTANGPLDQTISDMRIDGRDYDWNWILVPNSGVFGVSSGTSFTNTKNALIGGTDLNGTDYSMKFPEDPQIIEENYNWGSQFPESPDKALGYAEGTLKALALSGTEGSQYVTDPKNLKYPLRGVTFVELPSGVSWKGAKLGTDPSGILIVHNSSLTARIENTSTSNGTPFKGLILADYMFHIHLDVLGAIILLSQNLETVKECGGNQDHKVFFSREAIKRATSVANKQGTGWQGRVPIIGWRE